MHSPVVSVAVSAWDRRKVTCEADLLTTPLLRQCLCVVAGFRNSKGAQAFAARVRRSPEAQKAATSPVPVKRMLQRVRAVEVAWNARHACRLQVVF